MGLEIKGPVVLDIPADPASLFLARSLVEKLALRAEFAKEVADRIVLAVDEALSNVIRHAYDCQCGGRITLTLVLDALKLEIHIRDFGQAVDPEAFKARDLKDIRPGGLGIHFIQSAMDLVKYEAAPGGGTLLKMVKFRTQEETTKR